MHDTQTRQDTKRHGQHFERSTPRRDGTKENQYWPAQAGHGLQSRVKKRASSPQDPRQQRPSFDFAFRRPTAMQQFFASFSLERSFTLFGFIVAAFIVLLFGLDLLCGWPFRQASLLFDATSTVSGAVLLFLCWDVFREQVKGLIR